MAARPALTGRWPSAARSTAKVTAPPAATAVDVRSRAWTVNPPVSVGVIVSVTAATAGRTVTVAPVDDARTSGPPA